ncbi:MAG: class I SAM-dependent methyltransferase [Proteobacteria bacterium]|nr:class I SAM-dependent methyltransferase [Pseudomonadota bacterium]
MTAVPRSLLRRFKWNAVSFAKSLREDLHGLPARLTQPGRLGEPLNIVHHVGTGDFRDLGQGLLRVLVEIGGLQPHDHVLDIGCGNGRLAEPLARYLSSEGAYLGFDIVRRAIVTCRLRARGRANFRFAHADIFNAHYNPGGRIAEHEYRFPCGDCEVSFAFATSVFTHMQAPSIAHYLAESARVLRPGGRVLFTGFNVDAEAREALASGRAQAKFVPWMEGAHVLSAQSPEGGIAHDDICWRRFLADAGLQLIEFRPGGWRGQPGMGDGQDIFLAEKPA